MPFVVPLSILILLVFLITNYFGIIRHISVAGRRLFVGLTIVTVSFGIAQLFIVLSASKPNFWTWLLDSNQEFSLGTMFSTMQLVLVFVLALCIALFGKYTEWRQRTFWFYMSAVFLVLAIDESGFFQIHETMDAIVWRLGYSIIGGILALGAILLYWFRFRKQFRLFAFFLAGLALMGVGGIFTEHIIQQNICNTPGLGTTCNHYFVVEEFLEAAGGSMVLTAVFVFAQQLLTDVGWKVAKPGMVIFGVGAWGWIAASLWIVPSIEARFIATPVQVNYFDGTMRLIGYRPSSAVIAPGDTLVVDLYWLAEKPVIKDYHWSIRLLTQPDAETVAFKDYAPYAQYPSSAWLTGLIVKKSVEVHIPADAPVPASYWITTSIWRNTSNPTFYEFDDTEQRALDSQSVILGSIPALPSAALPSPPIAANYQFANDVVLTGYDLPTVLQTNDGMPIQFWWQTRSNTQELSIQYIHYVLREDRSIAFSVLDQEPFAGRFPTSDWPPNAVFSDRWEIALPDDIVPGEYDVLTGLYEAVTGNRWSVVDADGQPVTDNSILLGTVIVEEAP